MRPGKFKSGTKALLSASLGLRGVERRLASAILSKECPLFACVPFSPAISPIRRQHRDSGRDSCIGSVWSEPNPSFEVVSASHAAPEGVSSEGLLGGSSWDGSV